MNKQIAELEALIATALEQRKKAYKMRAPKSFTTAINHDLRKWNEELAKVVA